MGSRAAALEQAAGDVVGEVAEPEGAAAEVLEPAVTGHPRQQRSIAARSRRELGVPELTAELVQHRCVMSLAVRVDTAGDTGRPHGSTGSKGVACEHGRDRQLGLELSRRRRCSWRPDQRRVRERKGHALRIAPAAAEPGLSELDDEATEGYCEDLARVLVGERNHDRGNSVGGCVGARDAYRADYAKNPGRYG